MNIFKIFQFILLIFLFFKFKCSYYIPNIKVDHIYNNTYIYNNKSKISDKFLYGNVKKNSKGEIFRNIPRENSSNENITYKFTKLNESKGEFISWPNNNTNDSFFSIIAFEIDSKDNIYILDEGEKNGKIKLYKFNNKGEKIDNYNIFDNANLTICDFVFDEINNYAYISYYENLNNKTNSTENTNIDYKAGFLFKQLSKSSNREGDATKIMLNEKKFKYDNRYELSNNFIQNYFLDSAKKLLSIGLSCDGEVLFFSPLNSRMIFSVSTEIFRKKHYLESLSSKQVKEAYKNDSSSTMIAGNLGNLYFSGIENEVIYIVGQVDNDLSIFNYKGIKQIKIDKNRTFHWPTKMSIMNGTLYITSININITEKDNNNFTVYTNLLSTQIGKEMSYTFKCAGIGHKWGLKSYIIWAIFIFIVIFVLVFVFIGNIEDKGTNKRD